MHWIKKEDLCKVGAVSDFDDLLDVMLDDGLSEFQYVVKDGEWQTIKK